MSSNTTGYDYDIEAIRADFPMLRRRIGGHDLIYLDSAATSLVPEPVLQTVHDVLSNFKANIHRSSHALSREATDLYDQAHDKAAQFIGAADRREIVFVRNTTEAINLVAYSLMNGATDRLRLSPGDEVILTIMEHHSNLLPWQMVRNQAGVTLKVVDIHEDGTLNLEQLKDMLTERTKLVCCTHVSNVLGTINPIAEIARLAHQAGALLLVDGAQSVPHLPVDVKALDCDFLAFSGHKMLAPFGIGVLYGKRALLEQMTPFLRGGDMIAGVTLEIATWNELPWKFEAGTANLGGAIALTGAIDKSSGLKLEGAMDYLSKLGMETVQAHVRTLTSRALDSLKSIKGLTVYGPHNPADREGVVAFTVEGNSPHVIAQMLNDEGIAVRSGGHCAYPLAARLGVEGTVRASFYIYNTLQEVDHFIDTLQVIIRQKLL